MTLLLPMTKSSKPSTIKSLLKERPDHIEIDFGDPRLYQAGLKKYYVKSLASKGPRFQRHKIGTKNPLFMAHGSDTEENDAVYDETIKKLNLKKLRHSKSFATMPLPRLSPRDKDDKDNDNDTDAYTYTESSYENVEVDKFGHVIMHGEEEEEEEVFLSNENEEDFDVGDENGAEIYEEEEQLVYEYEYEETEEKDDKTAYK